MEDTRHLFIEFFTQAEVDELKTRETGLETFKDVEKVKIQFVGDTKSVLVAPANAMSYDAEARTQKTYAQKFPRHYQAFKDQNADLVDGTPLSELPGITASRIAEFKGKKVNSIEALAQMDGTALSSLGMHGREWKNKAQAWLDKAKDGAVDSKLAAQNEALQGQLAAMAKRLEAMEKGAPVKAAEPAETETVEDGPFQGWDKSKLRAHIKERTGSAVKGQPALETLKAMAEELESATAA